MKKLVNIDMSWDEIKRRAKNGASLSVLADLNGVNTAVMREIIKGLEEQTGEKLQFAPKEKAIKKTMKKQKIDHQKVVELYEAGKSVKEIAAEMETYDQNIYNHIAKYKKEKKEEPVPVDPIPKRRFNPVVLDCIDANIDILKDKIQNHEDQIGLLKKQLEDWEYLLEITKGGNRE